MVLSVFASVLYVVSTYFENDAAPAWILVCEIVLSVFFVCDYCVQYVIAPSKIAYLFSLFAVIDVLTIVPVFADLATSGVTVSFGFLRFARILRIFRIMRSYRLLLLPGKCTSRF